MQKEFGVLLRSALFLSYVCAIFFRELLGVVDAGLVIDGRENVPSLHVLRVDLGRFLAMGNDTFIVFISELHRLLVGLQVLELPESEFLVADAQQIRRDVLRVQNHVFQEFACLLVIILASWGSLDVICVCDSNFDHGQIVGQLFVLLLD